MDTGRNVVVEGMNVGGRGGRGGLAPGKGRKGWITELGPSKDRRAQGGHLARGRWRWSLRLKFSSPTKIAVSDRKLCWEAC